MSRRQATVERASRTINARVAQAFLPVRLRRGRKNAQAGMPVPRESATAPLMRNFTHLPRIQTGQELSRVMAIEQRIARLDTQEKSVAGSQREPRHIEDWVVGHGQPAQPQ